MKNRARSLLEEALRLRIGSGIAADFGDLNDLFLGRTPNEVLIGQTSHLRDADPVGSHTFFDLASLTKILATTTLAMLRVEQGTLRLEESLQALLPEYVSQQGAMAQVTVAELLSHTSGLPAWNAFYEAMKVHFGASLPYISVAEREAYFQSLLFSVSPIRKAGEKVEYSDLGFLILEKTLSSHFEQTMKSVWSAIPGSELHYRPVISDSYSSRAFVHAKGLSIAATENCPWRGLIQGQVHDDNTWTKGGVAGHAGVFGRLSDVQAWIRSVFSGKLISPSTLRTFTTEVSSPHSARRALGFDMPALDGSGSTGCSFSKNSVGHLGFTGTSLWVDLDRGRYAILLTNRVHPSRDDIRIRALRRAFHSLI